MPNLTDKQIDALARLKLGPASPWDFGSTTVNRLRKAGLAESFKTGGSKPGALFPTKPRTMLRITEAGLAILNDMGR